MRIGRPLVRLGAFVLFMCLFAMQGGIAATVEPYVINVVLSQTGSIALQGREEVDSLKTLEPLINKAGGIGGRPVKFEIFDDQSNPQYAVQLFSTILQKHPPVVLGPTSVASCRAVAPLVNNGPLTYCFSPGLHPTPGYMYSASISTLDLLTASARYLHDRKLTRIAIITTTDATGEEGERTIDAAFPSSGTNGTIIDREHVGVTDITASAQMVRIKQANPQVLIAWATGTPLGTILRAVNDVGLDVPVLTSSGNLNYPELEGFKSFPPRELLFPASPGDAPAELPPGPMKKAVDAYAAAFKAVGIRPDQAHTLPWDSGLMVVDALRKLGTEATAAQVKAYIDGLHGWNGINGSYDFKQFPQRGLGAGNVVMVKWNVGADAWNGVSKLGGAFVR